MQHDLGRGGPLALDAVEAARLHGDRLLARDADPRALRPRGDAQVEREARGRGGHAEAQRLPERVARVQLDADRLPLHGRLDPARRIRDRGQPAVLGRHPQVRGKLRPALAQVGRAAAVVWLHAEDVGLRAVGVPGAAGQDAALDLVDLLVVLVRPHIGREGRGQRVEDDLLQPVAEGRVAQERQQVFERVGILHDRAQFRALGGALPGQALVTGEDARHHAVMAIQPGDDVVGRAAVALLAADPPPERGAFGGHRVVDDVAREVPAPFLRRLRQRPARKEGGPVEPLRVQLDGQVVQPRLARPLIEPVDADQRLEPAELAPVEERRAVDHPVDAAQGPLQRDGRARVARGVGILHEHLERQQLRPQVVAGLDGLSRARDHLSRPQPAVRGLVFDDVADVAAHLVLERRVVEEERQRHEAVQPVGRALPAFGVAAEPAAALDVGPEFVEVAADAVGLDAQLAGQPARGPDRAQGQGRKVWRLKHGGLLRGVVEQ
ncbi:MAG: hypothetical protein BWY52_01718 [Chloroflexi bacterium ADurb.Bin325]|nr:MAG: hypothetical protein BWY52_01718 [Chloroflexi bacterium ADurb.Bin325]